MRKFLFGLIGILLLAACVCGQVRHKKPGSSVIELCDPVTTGVPGSGGGGGSWVHVQDAPGNNNMATTSGSTNLSAGPFANPNTVGNVVIAWSVIYGTASPAPSFFTCSDNANPPNTYNQVLYSAGSASDPHLVCVIFAANISHLPTSGNLNPVVSRSDLSGFFDVCASEFSGGTTTIDGSAVVANDNGAASTTASTGSISTTTSGDLLLAAVATSSFPTTFNTPSGFTKNGEVSSNTLQNGSTDWQITTSTVSNLNVQWSVSPSSNWACGVIALKPSGSGGGSGGGIDMRVDCPLGHQVRLNANFIAALKVTSVPSGGSPSLDVYLQHSCDDGQTWGDLVHFFPGGTGTFYAPVSSIDPHAGTIGPVWNVGPPQGYGLNFGQVIQGPVGDRLRVRHSATGGTSGFYMFQVYVLPGQPISEDLK